MVVRVSTFVESVAPARYGVPKPFASVFQLDTKYPVLANSLPDLTVIESPQRADCEETEPVAESEFAL